MAERQRWQGAVAKMFAHQLSSHEQCFVQQAEVFLPTWIPDLEQGVDKTEV
jgi:hypothetical protein